MKSATSGATFLTAARIGKIVKNQAPVTDNAMVETARTSPSIPSHNPRLGRFQRFPCQQNPSENCQIEKTATMMMAI